MRYVLIIVFLCAKISAQCGSITGAAHISGQVMLSCAGSTPPAPPLAAQLPQAWANPHEADLTNAPAGTVVTKTIKNSGGNYACTLAGLQQSMDDWAAGPNNQWWHVIVDDGSVNPSDRCVINITATGWVWKPKRTGTATGFIVYESAHPNAVGQTVCTHQTGISLVGASPRNPGCDTTAGISDIEHMWKIASTAQVSQGAAINATNQANVSHIVVKDVEISYIRAGYSVNVVNLSATHSGIERSYMHSDYDDSGASPSRSLISNFIFLGCQYCWLTWNYFDGIGRTGGEGHVLSGSQAGPAVKIAHNYIEGGEVGMMSGGNNGQPLGRSPGDIEIRANTWTRNPTWMLPRSGLSPAWRNCRFGGLKNSFELKDGVRFLLDGNVFENSVACGQSGQGPTLTVRPCSGYVTCQTTLTTVGDIVLTNNVIRHVVNGVQAASNGAGRGNGEVPGIPGRRWDFSNNLFYDVSNRNQRSGSTQYVWNTTSAVSTYWPCTAQRDPTGRTTTLNCDPGETSGNPNARNTLTLSANATATLGPATVTITATQCPTCPKTTTVSVDVVADTRAQASARVPEPEAVQSGLPFVDPIETVGGEPLPQANARQNRAADFSLSVSPSTVALARDSSVTTQVVLNPVNNWYSTGNGVQIAASGLPAGVTAGFNPGWGCRGSCTPGQIGIWNARTGMTVGDPVYVDSCSSRTFNVGESQLGPAALTGTNGLDVSGRIVVYPNPGTPNQTATGCMLRSGMGFPSESRVAHNTFIVQGSLRHPMIALSCTYGRPWLRGFTFENNITVVSEANYYLLPGCSATYGAAAQPNLFDVPTVTFRNSWWSITTQGRGSNPATYNGGGAPPISIGTAGSTMWVGAAGAQICPHSTADANCLGLNGFMSNAPFVVDPTLSSTPNADPLVFYAVHPSSLYKTGGSRQASDGTDLGADMERIRHALNSLIYTGCTPGACGPTGPFPD